MDKRLAGTLLALLLIVVTGLRLAFALAEPSLTFEGYQHARLVEHIAETGVPLRYDPLSFGGRIHVYSPLYYYILAPFTYLNTELALKAIPNLFYAFTLLLIYMISFEISKNRSASILAAVLAGFTPITFASYINTASPYLLAIPLFLGLIYALLEPKKRLPLLVVIGVLLSLVSPIILLAVAGIVIFIFLAALEGLPSERAYSETLFFLLFFGLWSVLLFFKNAFLDAGFSALWDYIPVSVITEYYASFTLLTAIGIVGALPLVFGAHATYHALFLRRVRKAFLILGMVLAILIALLFRMIPLASGAVLLTMLLCVLSAHSFAIIFRYFGKTRAPRIRYALTAIVLFFFLFASFFPALSEAAREVSRVPSEDHFAVAELLQGESIVAAPEEGFFFQYHGIATLADEDFLLVANAEARYAASEQLFASPFVLPVLELAEDYSFEYIVFSDVAKRAYLREKLFFINDCFRPKYGSPKIEVYEVICDVKQS